MKKEERNMNSKNYFKSIFIVLIILISVLFVSNSVFAETPKNFIKINSVNVTFPDSSNTRTCTVTINYSGEVKYASNVINTGLVVSETFYHHPHFLIAPKAINATTKQEYLVKLSEFSKMFWKNKSSSNTYTVNNKTVKIYKPNVTMVGIGANSSYSTNITPCLDYSEIEVIAFVPPHAGLTNYKEKFDNVMINNGNDYDLTRQKADIVNNISRTSTYYVNLDYKIATVPALAESSISAPRSDTGSGSQTPSVLCDDTFRTATELGYQASWKYKCSDDKTAYYKCDNGTVSGPYTFSAGSRLKTLICTDSVPAPTEAVVTEPQISTLDFNPNFYITEINYSIVANTWLKTSKLRDSDSFVVDDKDKDKNFSIALPGFTPNTDVYAIITTPDKSTEIYTELAYILSKDKFESYSPQTNNYEIRALVTAPLKQIFKLDAQSIFKFGIKKEVTNEKLVLIVMQKSTDGRKINLVYTNLYILDDGNQSLLSLCEINKRIVSFYCKGYNCNIPKSCIDRWDYDPTKLEGVVGAPLPGAISDAPSVPGVVPATAAPSIGNCSIDIQTTVEEYITCLRNNIETFSVTRSYALVVGGVQQGSAIVGNTLIDQKYNTNSLCETSQSFNDAVFTGAKNANLTEEETAQLWSRLAAESGCNSGVGCGDYCDSYGIAQINMTGWNNSSSYNLLKPYLIAINSSKYDTFAKYQSKLNSVTTDITSSVEISIAINKYHKSVILNKSRSATRPFTDLLDKTYDHNDSIDMEFATAYTYTGVSYADHFVDGIKVGATRYQGVVYPALHKMGYYLTYKRMIYICHRNVTTSAFVTAYKTKYQGTYCISEGQTAAPIVANPPAATPPATVTPPVTTTATLQKGTGDCYTTNAQTLATLRAGAITLTKENFSGRRTLTSVVSSGSATGTNDDPSITMAGISKIANMNTTNFSPHQKFKDASNAVYNLGLLYNVDPIYALAFFKQEKSMYNTKSGNYDNGALVASNNPVGITVGNGCACGGSRYLGGSYCQYPSLEAGFEAFYKNINSNTYKNKQLTTVASIWRYGRSGTTDYSNSLLGYMNGIYADAN